MDGFLWGVAALAGHMLSVTALLRLPRVSPMGVHLVSGVAGLGLLTAAGLIFATAFPFWHAVSLFCFGASAFMFAYSALYKSLSLRMLLSASLATGTRATWARLVDETLRTNFEERVDLLIAQGLAMRVGQAYRLTPRGQALSLTISRARTLFAIGTDGTYSGPSSGRP